MMRLGHILKICKPMAMMGPHLEPTAALTDDSRAVTQGSVFIAVKGTVSDGHDHIATAIQKGAVIVICERFEGADADATILLVKSTRAVLLPLALAFQGHPEKELKLVGVTGTNGKTTVSTLIWQVLRRLDIPAGLIGTVEKRINDEAVDSKLTTPGALELAADLRRAADAGCRVVAMEVSSHALDQNRTKGLKFGVALFTNLSHDHLDYHRTVEAYARAKRKLFDSLPKAATAITNFDDAQGAAMVAKSRATVWGVRLGESEVRLLSSSVDGLVLDIDGTVVSSPLAGRFNAYNVSQAYLACVALGLNQANVAAALSTAPGAPGRLERVPSPAGSPAVFVDYAHTPDALDNVLSTLAGLKSADQSLICVFGCGGNRDTTKRPKMASIAERHCDRVVITSDNPRFEDPELILNDVQAGFSAAARFSRIIDRASAIAETVTKADASSVIVIAGKGHETYQDIQGVRHPLDDRELAAAAIQRRIP